jgi:serpin B
MTSMRHLADSSNTFGYELYQRVSTTARGNLAISPASIATALAMALGGAHGATAAELERLLHVAGPADEFLAATSRLLSVLQDPKSEVTFRIANRLFGERSYDFVPAFLESTRALFAAPLEPLDFQLAPEPSRERINAWVEERTEKRIRALIPPGGIEERTRLVLVNALYFLGDWQQRFDYNSTSLRDFHLTATTTKDVLTMYKSGTFGFVETNDLKALELPYKGGQMSMLLVLPKALDGWEESERRLSAAALSQLVGSLQSHTVVIRLPKFEMNPAPIDLAANLRALGLTSAFDPQLAVVAGMAAPKGAADRLFLSAVFHKVFVRVDEKGTEAVAATAPLVVRLGARERPAAFFADHPFLLFIRDTATGLVIFQGRVTDPSPS